MAWKTGPNAPLGVWNDIAASAAQLDTVARVPIGTIREYVEDTLGPAELIYLPGVVNTVAGDLVEYDLTPGAQATIRHSNATASNSGRPVAVALSATGAGTFGWYQISGCAIVNATAASAVGACFATATAGSVNSAADAGDQILNARLISAVGTPAAGEAYLMMQRPFVQGQIT